MSGNRERRVDYDSGQFRGLDWPLGQTDDHTSGKYMIFILIVNTINL